MTIFLPFGQVDLKDDQPEFLVCLVPQAVHVAGRTNKSIAGFGRIFQVVDRNDRFSFQDIEYLGLHAMVMRSLPGVRRDGHDLEQMTCFGKVIQREDDLLAVILFYDLCSFAGRSVFHTGSISNIAA